MLDHYHKVDEKIPNNLSQCGVLCGASRGDKNGSYWERHMGLIEILQGGRREFSGKPWAP